MKKRMISFVLALCVTMSLCVIGASAETTHDREKEAVNFLYSKGLFKGIGTNKDGTPDFALNQLMTRGQAAIMIVRLIGKEQTALNTKWDIPFTDVKASLKPYVGYAYANNIIKGVSSTKFNPNGTMMSNHYFTFCYRAMGYRDPSDFTVENALGYTGNFGFGVSFECNPQPLTRGEAARISAGEYLSLCKKIMQTETPMSYVTFKNSFNGDRLKSNAKKDFLNEWIKLDCNTQADYVIRYTKETYGDPTTDFSVVIYADDAHKVTLASITYDPTSGAAHCSTQSYFYLSFFESI